MIICNNSYNGSYNSSFTTVKFEEIDLNKPLFGFGFSFEHLIVPLYIKQDFINSISYQNIIPIINALKMGKIEYIDFKGRYRKKQLKYLLG